MAEQHKCLPTFMMFTNTLTPSLIEGEHMMLIQLIYHDTLSLFSVLKTKGL